MQIIARRTLREFVGGIAGHKDQHAVKAALDAWFDEVSRAAWGNTADVRRLYATASIVNADRVVFNASPQAAIPLPRRACGSTARRVRSRGARPIW